MGSAYATSKSRGTVGTRHLDMIVMHEHPTMLVSDANRDSVRSRTHPQFSERTTQPVVAMKGFLLACLYRLLLPCLLPEHEQPVQVRPPSKTTQEATKQTSHAPKAALPARRRRERFGLPPLEQDRVVESVGLVALGSLPQAAPAADDKGYLKDSNSKWVLVDHS